MKKYQTILILCLNIAAISAQQKYEQQHEQVSVENVIATKDGNGQVLLKFTLSVPSKTLGANDILILTPVLITNDGSGQHALSPIYAYGRTSALSARRKRNFAGRAKGEITEDIHLD